MTKINVNINGTTVEIEVEDGIAKAYLAIEKETEREEERVKKRKQRYNVCSFESIEESGHTIADKNSSIEDLLMLKRKRKAMRYIMQQAFNELKPKQKKLFYQVFILGEDQRKIAEKEGVSESAISQRLVTIRKAYKKNLKKFFKKP